MLTDHKTSIDGTIVYYRAGGDPAKPHLIFFNGWGARLNGIFGSDKVIEELSKHFYVVSPELPGFMRSEPPKEVWKVDDFATFIYKLLQPLNLENPVVMGQSFGGGVAALYTMNFVRKAKCLILVDAVLAGRIENCTSPFFWFGAMGTRGFQIWSEQKQYIAKYQTQDYL